VTQIDGKRRVLMPGLIDNHYHTAFASGKMVSFFQAIRRLLIIVLRKRRKRH